MSGFTAAHVAGWAGSWPRNLQGPLGPARSLGRAELTNLVEVTKFASDVGAGTAVVITHGLATRDVKVQVFLNSSPWKTVECEVEHTDANTITLRFDVAVTASQYRVVVLGRVPTPVPDSIKPKHPRVLPPARRGQLFRFPMVGRAPGQLDTQPFIAPANRRRNFTLARRGRIAYFPIVGRAPGQLDTQPFIRQTRRPALPSRRWRSWTVTPVGAIVSVPPIPDRIDAQRPRIYTARRGQFYRFPMVGFAPGQLDTPPFIRQTRRPALPSRRWRSWGPPIVGLAPGQFVVPDRIKAHRAPALPPRRGRISYWCPPVTQQAIPNALISSRHPRSFALARRGQFYDFPIVGRAPGQLDTPPFIRQTRRPALPARRWRSWGPPITAVVAPAAPSFTPDRIDSQRARIYAARRGRYLSYPFPFVAPPVVVPAAPDIVKPANRRRAFALARRGWFASFPLTRADAGALVPTIKVSRRTAGLPSRRGQFFAFSFTITQAPTPTSLKASRRISSLPVRRGQFLRFTLTATQQPVSASFLTRRVQRIAPARRGRFFSAPLTQTQTPVIPVFVGRRRPTAVLARRGEFQQVPIIAPAVITFRRSRRPLAARVLPRPRFQPVPGAPDVPRRVISPARRPINVRPRRGSFQAVSAASHSVSNSFFPFFG